MVIMELRESKYSIGSPLIDTDWVKVKCPLWMHYLLQATNCVSILLVARIGTAMIHDHSLLLLFKTSLLLPLCFFSMWITLTLTAYHKKELETTGCSPCLSR